MDAGDKVTYSTVEPLIMGCISGRRRAGYYGQKSGSASDNKESRARRNYSTAPALSFDEHNDNKRILFE